MKNNLEDLVREYGHRPTVGPDRCRKDVMAEITALITENVEADAYNIACELMEEGWSERAKRGVEIGTQGSLCDGISWIFDHMKKLESAPDLPDVPYSGLEQRFFQGLNTITRRAVLQVLGGHTDAFMEQVRNRGDERRLFKHLFKADTPDPRPLFDRKLHDLQQRGYEVIGRILHKDGQYALFDSSCRWLEKAQYQRLMHEQDGSLFSAPTEPSTGYAKHGYILEAADGHQTWLKGDPATGMGRYGKIIQLYKKEPPCLP